jgi:hypothetical protein
VSWLVLGRGMGDEWVILGVAQSATKTEAEREMAVAHPEHDVLLSVDTERANRVSRREMVVEFEGED